jgi:putative peptide maturation dehydrogenase
VHGEGDPPFVTSALTGKTAPLDEDGLRTLFSIPQGMWIEVEHGSRVADLIERGLLLTHEDAELRARDERLTAGAWHPAAAVYHFSTRVRSADLQLPDEAEIAAKSEEAVAQFVARHGPPPGHFHSVHRPRGLTKLPLMSREGGLYDVLDTRRTSRSFEPRRPLSLEHLAILLYEVFGCRAYATIHPEVIALRKSSPSAGGLHPIEAYPLVRNVDGVASGLYHYGVRDHVLELVAPLEQHEAEAVIAEATAGQRWLGSAAAVVLLTVRFARSFWKYRRSPTAYATLLMDAGHLSQTFYLVSAELGLGAFLTNVVDSAAIVERLGLDDCAEGPLAVLGCGFPADTHSPLDPQFVPFTPRETTI